jgi:hypothetical protein
MSPRIVKSEQELYEASTHFGYEWRMFEECVKRLALNTYEKDDPVLYQATLTAFTIYFRNLLDFFYPSSSPNADDMLASEYYSDPQYWEKQRPPLTDTLKVVRIKVNKLSAHLSYKRVEWVGTWWVWSDLYSDLSKIRKVFLDTVPSHRLKPESKQPSLLVFGTKPTP